MGANMLVFIVGYDVTSPSGPDQPSLFERISAEEFGPLDPDFDGSPASVASWVYWQEKEKGVELGGWSGGGESRETLILGKKVAEAYDCVSSRKSVGPVTSESLAPVVEAVSAELRKIGVTATPELHLLWVVDA